MNVFDDPAADVVEVRRGGRLDLVALIGESRGVAFVSVDGAPAVRVQRRRSDVWRCAAHGRPSLPCRHVDDVIRAVTHLDIEDQTLSAGTVPATLKGKNHDRGTDCPGGAHR